MACPRVADGGDGLQIVESNWIVLNHVVADNQQGVVFQLRGWAKFVTKC
jgi:hypothetical protein